ncbi:DUF6508 domain-containing protein [Arcticibacter sp. MXS-1]|uniref:DUF6508 domain-containing protein n=1 Tax=Arcticibacter sp. MXS-1 TaxID=3341726 RepID=UPI0035A895BE
MYTHDSPYTPESIIPYIYSVPLDNFRRLLSLIDDIEREKIFGEVVCGTINGISYYGGFEEATVVSNFRSYCYQLNLVICFPDCPKWKEGGEYLRAGCPGIQEKDLLFIIKAITYALRQDKFVDGSLIGLFRNGSILALLKRLKELIEGRHSFMKNNWNSLKGSQLGKYAEYFTKMEFTQYGFDVYSSEVDDKGIDFLVKKNGKYYEIQVKSVLKSQYVFMPKSKFEPKASLYLALVLYTQGECPGLYLIPSQAWLTPNALVVDRPYSESHKSQPEYGLQLSVKNRPLLHEYSFEKILLDLL